LGLVTEISQSEIDLNESVLNCIFRLFLVPEDSVCDSESQSPISVDNLSPSPFITFSASFQQSFLFHTGEPPIGSFPTLLIALAAILFPNSRLQQLPQGLEDGSEKVATNGAESLGARLQPSPKDSE